MEEQIQGLRELIGREEKFVNSKFISVASGKGGVGKTNFAVNFAYVLANSFGKKVLLIDADIGMANVHILLNTDLNRSIKKFLDGSKIEDLIVSIKGFDAIFGFSGIDSIAELEDFRVHRMIYELNKVSQLYDYVIIDNSPGIGEKVISFLRASNTSYIITTPEPTSIMDSYAVIKSLYKLYGYSRFKIVVSMCKRRLEEKDVFDKLNFSANKFLNINLELAGKLSFSKNLEKCVKDKKLIAEVYPSDPYTTDLKEIAAKEVGEPVLEKNTNFWEKVLNFLKQRV
jgi:flagellar biosynthesis protein FlhG